MRSGLFAAELYSIKIVEFVKCREKGGEAVRDSVRYRERHAITHRGGVQHEKMLITATLLAVALLAACGSAGAPEETPESTDTQTVWVDDSDFLGLGCVPQKMA